MIAYDLSRMRWFSWMTVVVGATFAVVLASGAVGSVTGEPARPGVAVALALGALFASLGVANAALRFLRRDVPHRLSTERHAEQEATVLWLHRARSAIGLPLLVLVTLAPTAGAVALFLDDEPGGAWICVGLAAFFASFLPDTTRALLRRPCLVLTPTQVVYRGAAVDARVDWEDVSSICAERDARGDLLMVRAATVARSLEARRTRIIWPVEGRPSPHAFGVPCLDPRESELLGPVRAWVESYLRHPPSRHELGTPAAADRLRRLRDDQGRWDRR